MTRESLTLLPYQQKALDFLQQPAQNMSRALFIDMGLGKTAVVLRYLLHLLTDTPNTHRVLVIGPKRVIQHTWPEEIGKWEEFKYLKFAVADGDAGDRRDQLNRDDVHMHLISRDNVQWLVANKHLKADWKWDIVVIDELSSFKNHDSARWKALKKVRPFVGRVIGMTGTPAPNGLINLWPQVSLLDMGRSLGKNITAFRQAYFDRDPFTPFPKYTLREGADKKIADSIKDITISMAAEDYLDLPPIKIQEVSTTPDWLVKKQYTDFKKDMVIKLQGGLSTEYLEKTITAVNAGALCGKLLQFCGGRLYDENKEANFVHKTKELALDTLLEEASNEGRNVLIYYAYKHEKEYLLEHCKAKELAAPGNIEKWQRGEIPIAVAHPASAGHGLNLQSGGSTIIWYNITYDLELWLQANKRLHRMGQVKPVSVFVLTIDGMTDSQIFNTVISGKESVQKALINELKA